MSSTTTHAQTADKIDSLLHLLENTSAHLRPSILISLSEQYLRSDLDKSLEFAQKGLIVSKKEGQPSKIAHCLHLIAQVHIEQGNYEDAKKISEESNQIYTELSDSLGIAWNLTNLGLIAHYKGEYKKAIEHYEKSLKYIPDNSNHTARTLNYLGRVHQNQGSYDLAMEYYIKALKLSKSTNNEHEIASSLGRIGEIHDLQNNYEEAISFAYEALRINKRINNKRGEEANLNNLGNIYLKQEEYQKAMEHFHESLDILRKMGKKQEIASRIGNIGTVYFYMNDLEQAKAYYLEALDIETQLGNKRVVAYVLLNLGYVFKQQGKTFEAINYFNKSLEIAHEIGKKNLTMLSYLNLSRLYANINNFEKAYEYHKAYAAVNDSILDEKSRKQLAEIQTKYETEKKEKEIAVLKSDQILKEKELKENKAQLQFQMFVIIGLIIVVFFVVILIRMYKQKLIAKQLLLRKNEEIADQKMQTLMKSQKIDLIKASIAAREQERHRFSRELHDGIGGSLSAIKVNLSRYEDDYNLSEVINSLDKTCQDVRALSHDLVPPSIMNSIYTDLLESYIFKVCALHQIECSFHCYPESEINELDESIQTELYRIIQELLTNIVKHAKASTASVQLSKLEDYINLIVEDNGLGLPKESKANGIGLLNIQSRVKKLNGKIEFDSSEKRGTLINIDIPVFEPKFSNLDS